MNISQSTFNTDNKHVHAQIIVLKTESPNQNDALDITLKT